MIIDSIESFEKYLNLHKDFQKVYDFIKDNNLQTLEPKQYSIVKDDVWCTIWEGVGREYDEDVKLEIHDSFIDIHVLLEGQETIAFRDRVKCSSDDVKYDEASDIAFLEETPEVYVNYGIYNFVICFPKDAHAPLIGEGKIKKAIFKVRV